MTTPEDPADLPPGGSGPAPIDPYFTPPPGASQPGPPQFGAPGYGQPQYGAPQFGGTPYGQPPYGAQPPYGQPPWGQPPYAGQYQSAASYASWLQRVGAAVLDWFVTFLPTLVVVGIGVAIGHGIGVFIAILGYIGGIALWIWNAVFRQGRTGQTVGKQQVGIKLIREVDGQVVGPGMSFVRQIAHFLDGLVCDIGYLWPLWDAKRQTFADKVCSTVVIRV